MVRCVGFCREFARACSAYTGLLMTTRLRVVIESKEMGLCWLYYAEEGGRCVGVVLEGEDGAQAVVGFTGLVDERG